MKSKAQSQLLRELGITEAMEAACRLPLCEEATHLVDAGEDILGRPQKMTPETFKAWRAMQSAALQDGIKIELVSAYRSIAYQGGLIRRRLAAGGELETILKASAPPGYSEHHTGRALDLHAGEGPPLTEAFEQEPAFDWLCKQAAAFGFRLSYPRDNDFGIIYEPWHWCYQP